MSRIDSLFGQALAIGIPEERSAFLDQIGEQDASLRRELDDLLAAHAQAGSFLENSPLSGTEACGTLVGNYKLLEQIGEGGMGVVFMAEQLRPVRRRVALKIIKPGMDTRRIIARFEAERQALAMMDHPNIAKVFDAGTTESGRPYFVMELVRGVPITDYCDQNKLTTAERLNLFVQVCQAVQHAHQKGIIHRDLKPTNVLVTLNDGKPTPKVIDFGIAKAAGAQRLTERTLFTEFRQLIGTPLYMSPEQAEMSAVQDVDTRSDVYSLGVLLYELLTGTTPFDRQRLADAAYDEVRRIIREEEPPRPSTRLSTLGQTLSAVSSRRQTEVRKLSQTIRGELDWIVMKSLEKDRTRRYETANSLARDVERFLADQPVEACPPSRFYLLHKHVRRHRRALMATGVAAIVLLAATAVSTWEAVRATRARDAEAAQRRQAEAVADLLESAFRGMDPAEYDGSRDFKTRLVSRLDGVAASLEAGYAGEPLVRARLRNALGETRLGLGDARKAEALFSSALEEQRRYAGADAEETLVTMDDLGLAYRAEGRFDEAIRLMEQARDRRIRTRGALDAGTLHVMNDLATAYFSAGRVNDSISLLERVRIGETRTLGAGDPGTLRATSNLAGGYLAAGRFNDAIKLLEQVREEQVKRLGPDHPDALSTLNNLTTAYISAGRFQEALALAEQVRDANIRKLGPDHPDTLEAAVNVAQAIVASGGRVRDAIQLLEQVRDRQMTVLGANHPDTLRTMTALAAAYRMSGRYGEAIKLLEQARDGQVKELGPDHRDTLDTMDALARAYGAAGRTRDQIGLLEELRDRQVRVLGPDHPNTLAMMDGLADAYRSAGRNDMAIKLLEEVRDRKHKALGPDHPQTLRTVETLAGAYREAARFGPAIKLLEEVRDRRVKVMGVNHPATLEAMSDLAVAYRAAGKIREAIALLERVHDQIVRQPGVGDPNDLVTVEQELAGAYGDAGRVNDSVSLLEHVRDQRRKMLGDDHPSTLTTMNNLANAYLSASRTGEAIALLEQVRDREARQLAQDHPELLTTEDNLSEAYEYAGRLDEALALREQVLAREVKKLGAEHPDTLATMNNLAEAYRKAGRTGEAIKLLEQVRDGEIKTLGTDHPDLLTTLNNLGLAYWSAGRNEDAIRLLEEVRDRRVKANGLTHPNTITTMHNLALAYQSAHRTAEAITLFEQVRDANDKVLGADHADTLQSMTALALAYRDVRRADEAIALCEQARDRSIRRFGPDAPITLRSLNVLGRVYRDGGRSDEAIALLKKVRERQAQLLGPDHPDTLNTAMNLAIAYQRVNRNDGAIEVYEQIREPLLAKNSGSSADARMMRGLLAGLYREKGRLKDAFDLDRGYTLAQSAKQKTAALTTRPTDPALLSARGTVYARLGRFRDAADDFAKAIELAPDNHLYWHEGLMPLLLELGDRQGFHQRLGQELQQFRETSDPSAAHRVAKDAFMLPAEGDELATATALADRALSLYKDRRWSGCQTKGMAEYRSGHFEAALKWLTESRKLTNDAKQQTIADLFLAMSCQQLGDYVGAQETLDRAVRMMDARFPRPGEGDFAGFSDLILCRAVRHEAEGLINGMRPTTKPITATQPSAVN